MRVCELLQRYGFIPMKLDTCVEVHGARRCPRIFLDLRLREEVVMRVTVDVDVAGPQVALGRVRHKHEHSLAIEHVGDDVTVRAPVARRADERREVTRVGVHLRVWLRHAVVIAEDEQVVPLLVPQPTAARDVALEVEAQVAAMDDSLACVVRVEQPGSHRCIHLRDVRERAARVLDAVRVIEVRVGGVHDGFSVIEYFHNMVFRTAASASSRESRAA